MAVQPFKKLFLVNSAQTHLNKPPAGLAFLCGVCEHLNIEYQAHDINIEFLLHAGKETWENVFAKISAGGTFNDLTVIDQEKIDQYISHAVDQLLAYNPDCIAITITTYMQQQWTERFLKHVKTKTNVPIIAGGSGIGVPYYILSESKQTDSFGTYMIKNQLVDFYILGEGDLVIQKFFQGQRDNIGLNGHDCLDQWQPQIDDLDSVPQPSYKKIPLAAYNDQNTENLKINITSSRGCVRRCSFCDVGHIWKKFRYRSGKKVVDEMVDYYQSTGATSFWFTDSLVNGNIKQFNEMLENVVDRKQRDFDNKQLVLSGQFIIRPQQSHPEKMFQLMSAAGFIHPSVGIESGSESVRDHIGKKFSNADIDWHFQMSEKYGIKNWLLMMVGYPTETADDFQDTCNLLINNQKYVINQTILGVNVLDTFSLLPNTPLERVSAELGLYRIYDDVSAPYVNWYSSSNPSLTLIERSKRFIDLIELMVDLRYPFPDQVQHYFEHHFNQLEQHKVKKVIPIKLY